MSVEDHCRTPEHIQNMIVLEERRNELSELVAQQEEVIRQKRMEEEREQQRLQLEQLQKEEEEMERSRQAKLEEERAKERKQKQVMACEIGRVQDGEQTILTLQFDLLRRRNVLSSRRWCHDARANATLRGLNVLPVPKRNTLDAYGLSEIQII